MLPNQRHAAARPYRLQRRDDGQVTLLIVGFMIIVLLLVVVAVNASRVFLAQRDLSAAADGASVAAAQAVSEEVVYGGEPGELLPIDPAGAAAAAAHYLELADLGARFQELALVSVVTNGTEVSVTLSARVHLPMTAVLPGDSDGSYVITTTATARSPFG